MSTLTKHPKYPYNSVTICISIYFAMAQKLQSQIITSSGSVIDYFLLHFFFFIIILITLWMFLHLSKERSDKTKTRFSLLLSCFTFFTNHNFQNCITGYFRVHYLFALCPFWCFKTLDFRMKAFFHSLSLFI